MQLKTIFSYCCRIQFVTALAFLAVSSRVALAVNIWDNWVLSDAVVTDSWSSGDTKNLSSWETLDCSTYGPDHLLSSLTGYKDPWANLDRFVARLDATCTSFDLRTTHRVTLSVSDHRDERYKLDVLQHPNYVCPAFYNDGPFGGRGMVGELLIGTDPARNYVQNLNILAHCVKRRPEDGVLFWTTIGYETYLIDDPQYIDFSNPGRAKCPAQDYVATGIAVRYDTKKGKIRDVRLMCRQVIRKAQ